MGNPATEYLNSVFAVLALQAKGKNAAALCSRGWAYADRQLRLVDDKTSLWILLAAAIGIAHLSSYVTSFGKGMWRVLYAQLLHARSGRDAC